MKNLKDSPEGEGFRPIVVTIIGVPAPLTASRHTDSHAANDIGAASQCAIHSLNAAETLCPSTIW